MRADMQKKWFWAFSKLYVEIFLSRTPEDSPNYVKEF